MKRTIAVMTILMPAIAHAESFASGSLIGGIITQVITVSLFLVLREVVLWYWKINTIIENQAKQIVN
jgi:hypothetical protein